MDIAFKIFGRTRLRTAGQFVADWGKPKERAVLAVLLLHSGKPLSVNTIAEWVWPDRMPGNPYTTLQTYMTRIRGALSLTGTDAVIRNEDRAYRLDVDRSLIDYFAFLDTMAAARRIANGTTRDFAAATALAEEALGLWEGEPLADLDGERVRSWRHSIVRQYYLTATNELLYGLGRLGEYEQMLVRLNEIQPEHDLDVLLARHRLVALFGLRKRVEAASYHVDIRRRIRAEIGDGSEEELRQLYEELRVRHAQPVATANNGSRPRYLPPDVDVFAGQENLLSRLDSLVLPHPPARLIALDGLPGVGKTTLAVHWAHRVRERFEDGCWFSALDGVANGPRVDAGEVVKELLGEFGVAADTIPSVRARLSRLRELLSTRRMLVILDNVADADHIRPLLPALFNCVVVVTSRSRLSELAVRDNARCLTVDPLGEDETVAWLGNRLGARADAAPNALARLAALADGMPLAMGLIGEQVAAQPRRSLDDFVDWLTTGHTVLSLGGIRAAFELSYRNLGPRERQLFRLLGLHPVREVSLDIVAALAGVRREIARELVDSLVWKRLIDPVDGDHYRMHDLLREYAAECAEQDEEPAEREAAVSRMLGYYLHTVNNADRRVFGYREPVPMLPLPDGVNPREFADEDEVAKWCLQEETALVGVARNAASPAYVWRLANGVGELFYRYSRNDALVAVMTAGASAAKQDGDVGATIDTYNNLGFIFMKRRHDYESADRCFREARRVFGDRDDPETLAVLIRNQAEAMRGVQNMPTAIGMYQEALGFAVTADTRAGILHRLGEACYRGSRFEEAASYLYKALHLREELSDHKGHGDTLVALARLARDRGDHLGALNNCHLAIGMYQQAHEITGEATVSTVLAAINRDFGDLESARHYADHAVELCRGLDREIEAVGLDLLAHIQWRSGELDDAVTTWEQAYEAFRDLDDPRADGIGAQLDELEAFVQPEVPASRLQSETPDRFRGDITT